MASPQPQASDWTEGLEDWLILGIWNACSSVNEWPGPVRKNVIRHDLLTSTSHTGIHYGIGGEIHELTCVTVGLKAGLRLGFIRTTGSAMEGELDGDQASRPDLIPLQ